MKKFSYMILMDGKLPTLHRQPGKTLRGAHVT